MKALSKYAKVYSLLHRGWVRFLGWTPDGYARVCDKETLAELPDLVHFSQIA